MKNRNVNIPVVIGVIVLIVGIIFTVYDFRLDRFGMSMISWVDCVQINDIKYGSYSEERTSSIEPSLIDKKIGIVKFKICDNVHNSNYRFRNGDATFLDVGTEIYSIKSEKNAIAVKIDGQYFLYKADI